MEKAKNSNYYTFLAYQNMKYKENLEKRRNEEFLLYKENVIKEMLIYKEEYPKKGYTHYNENIENTVQDFEDNFISGERLNSLLNIIQNEVIKSCNLSNQQLISLTKLIKRNRYTYLTL
jgi:hypothetical protein